MATAHRSVKTLKDIIDVNVMMDISWKGTGELVQVSKDLLDRAPSPFSDHRLP